MYPFLIEVSTFNVRDRVGIERKNMLALKIFLGVVIYVFLLTLVLFWNYCAHYNDPRDDE